MLYVEITIYLLSYAYMICSLYSAFRLSVALSTAGGDGNADSPGPGLQIQSNTSAARLPTIE